MSECVYVFMYVYMYVLVKVAFRITECSVTLILYMSL